MVAVAILILQVVSVSLRSVFSFGCFEFALSLFVLCSSYSSSEQNQIFYETIPYHTKMIQCRSALDVL
jgi:hypothetical protein